MAEIIDRTTALENARELVRNGWCQGTAARDSNGREAHPLTQEKDDDWPPVQFDICGAVARATHSDDDREREDLWPTAEEAFDYLVDAIRELHGWNMAEHPYWAILHDFNDYLGREKDEVVAVFTRAIELSKEAA